MPRWTHVVIHHSLTPDGPLPDVVAIDRFHTSYRQGGNIITADEYREKKEDGESGLVSPWRDIGYHWLIDTLSDGKPRLIQGRNMMMVGAHCTQQGMNRRGIGLCIVGDFDEAPPTEVVLEKAAEVTSWLCRMYRIPVDNVLGHTELASYKSCPGKKFDMLYFKERVADYLSVWKPPGQ